MNVQCSAKVAIAVTAKVLRGHDIDGSSGSAQPLDVSANYSLGPGPPSKHGCILCASVGVRRAAKPLQSTPVRKQHVHGAEGWDCLHMLRPDAQVVAVVAQSTVLPLRVGRRACLRMQLHITAYCTLLHRDPITAVTIVPADGHVKTRAACRARACFR